VVTKIAKLPFDSQNILQRVVLKKNKACQDEEKEKKTRKKNSLKINLFGWIIESGLNWPCIHITPN
jgi:hypothetical protein